VAGAGYWMAASHLSRACGRQRRWGRGRRETERQRGRLGDAGECLEVEDAWPCGGIDRGGGRREWKGVGGGFGGAGRKHHRHSVRHTAFSMDARTE